MATRRFYNSLLVSQGCFQGLNSGIQFANGFNQWCNKFLIVHLQVITFCAYQLWIDLLYILCDQANIRLVVVLPVECHATEFKQILRRVFQALDILFQAFIAEWAAIAANATRVWRAANIIADAIVADLLLNRTFGICSGGQ
ncbi:hypothetical protein HA62_21170 [Pseudomonas putida]|nr:hypothetical protein HA62_21170 [Pseudomonas putida]